MAAKKHRRTPPSIGRKKGKKKPKIFIYAYCEGANTEPQFIEDFSLSMGNGLVSVEATGASGVPKTIVNKAASKKRELERYAKKSGDPLDKAFQVWAVFDRDEHPMVPEAFEKADSNGIRVAYSNPCFELWPLLHLREQSAEIHRHDLQRRLGEEIPSYDPKRSKNVNLNSLGNNYRLAKSRALRLKEMHNQVGSPKANPYTDVYKLFDVIIENGKV